MLRIIGVCLLCLTTTWVNADAEDLITLRNHFQQQYRLLVVPALQQRLAPALAKEGKTAEEAEVFIGNLADKLTQCYLQMLDDHYRDYQYSLFSDVKSGASVPEAIKAIDFQLVLDLQSTGKSYQDIEQQVQAAQAEFRACGQL